MYKKGWDTKLRNEVNYQWHRKRDRTMFQQVHGKQKEEVVPFLDATSFSLSLSIKSSMAATCYITAEVM
jgi:hypothetical protein